MLFLSRKETPEKKEVAAKPNLVGKLGNALKNKVQRAVEIANPMAAELISRTKGYFENKFMEVTNFVSLNDDLEDSAERNAPYAPVALQETYESLAPEAEEVTEAVAETKPADIADFASKARQKAAPKMFLNPAVLDRVGKTPQKPGVPATQESLFDEETTKKISENVVFASYANAFKTPFEMAQPLAAFYNEATEEEQQALVQENNRLPLTLFKAFVSLSNVISPIQDEETRLHVRAVGYELAHSNQSGADLYNFMADHLTSALSISPEVLIHHFNSIYARGPVRKPANWQVLRGSATAGDPFSVA